MQLNVREMLKISGMFNMMRGAMLCRLTLQAESITMPGVRGIRGANTELPED